MDIPTLTHFDARRFGMDGEDPGETGGIAYMEVRSRAGDRQWSSFLSLTGRCCT